MKKLVLNKLKNILIYVLYRIATIVIAILFNRLFELLLFLIAFRLVRSCFNKQFHADILTESSLKAVRLCRLITISVEMMYLIICINTNITIYSNLIIVISIAALSYFLQYFLERNIINKSILKDKSRLLSICEEHKISLEATNRLVLHYIDNKTINEIALIECVNPETIKQSIRRSKRILGI